MAKAILIIGKICCGKSTYARQLAARSPAVIFSVDEFMLPLFGQHCARHREYQDILEPCLLQKASEIVRAGLDVILDWGFWNSADRAEKAAFFRERGIAVEWHYIPISQARLRAQVEERNRRILEEGLAAYYVDAPLAQKCESIFEPPSAAEGLDIHGPQKLE